MSECRIAPSQRCFQTRHFKLDTHNIHSLERGGKSISTLGDVSVEVSQELPPGGGVPGEDGLAEVTHVRLQRHVRHQQPVGVTRKVISQEGSVSGRQLRARQG